MGLESNSISRILNSMENKTLLLEDLILMMVEV